MIIPSFLHFYKKITCIYRQKGKLLDLDRIFWYNSSVMNEYYSVRKFHPKDTVTVSVPASKSITNRALLLAALSRGTVALTGGALSEDTRAFLNCLVALGIRVERRENTLLVFGCGGNIPEKRASINVESAGTAARFLTVALAFCGGDYMLDASEQMKRRPMKEILDLLREAGVQIECLEEADRFPFRLRSGGITASSITADTEKSSQYASALLMAAGALDHPFTLRLTGPRTHGSYIGITLRLLTAFNVPFERKGDEIVVSPSDNPPAHYEIEPDVSGACYFYALSLLFRTRVLVRGVQQDSMQGDMKFLDLLKDKGVRFTQTDEGLLADGRSVASFGGFDADMKDFSDQALTVAALAPFATSETHIRNVGHIRLQECDRMQAITVNLNALGVPAEISGDDIVIRPAPVRGGTVQTFGDHRVAMAFALIGLKTGNVTIENPACCKKTFENYFELLDELTE